MSNQILARYIPQSETLRSFHEDKESEVRVLVGPLGSGKTSAVAMELLDWICSVPYIQRGADRIRYSRFMVTRAHYAELTNTTLKDWLDIAGELGRMVYSKPPVHHLDFELPDGSIVLSQVIFFALDQFPKAPEKIRGFQLTGGWVSEAKEHSWPAVRMLLSRTGRFPRRYDLPEGKTYRRGLVLDTNAPPDRHWLGEIRKKPPKGWAVFNQPPAVVKISGRWTVNPRADNLRNLTDGYYARWLDAGSQENKNEDWIRANLANQGVLVLDGKPVHPDFSQSVHVSSTPLTPMVGVPLSFGVDFGRTPAAIFGQRQSNGQWLIFAEVAEYNMSVHQFAKRFLLPKIQSLLAEGYVFDMSYGDPAGSAEAQTRDESVYDILFEAGVTDVMPAPSNLLEPRLAAVDTLLTKIIQGEPAILIDPSCSVLIHGLAGGYHFRVVESAEGSQVYANRPVKTPSSHAVEALQYLLLGNGEGYIEDDRDIDYTKGWSDSKVGVA